MTDSPLRSTSGQLEQLALFSAQVCGQIDHIPEAGELVSQIATEANAAMEILVQHANRQ